MFEGWSRWAPITLLVIAISCFFYGISVAGYGVNQQAPNTETKDGQAQEAPEGLALWVAPIDDLARRYEKLVLVFGTAALAVFTYALWWATKRLWLSAEISCEHQLRAYVGVERAFLQRRGSPYVGFILRNYGSTPAHDVAGKTICESTADNTALIPNLPRGHWPHEIGIIDPNGTRNGMFPVQGDDADLEVFVSVQYRDAFKNIWLREAVYTRYPTEFTPLNIDGEIELFVVANSVKETFLGKKKG